MTRRQIKKLVLASYTRNELDPKKVKKIADLLKRSELKQYIKELKLLENQKKITILTQLSDKRVQNFAKKQFSKIFKDKKIIINTDPSLIIGVKIIDNDLIYDLNLKNTLNNLNYHINTQYD